MNEGKAFEHLTQAELKLVYNQFIELNSSNKKKDSLSLVDSHVEIIVNQTMDKTFKSLSKLIEQSVEKAVAPIKETLEDLVDQTEYTIQEVATITGKHHKTVRNWIDDGDLEADKLGKTWVIKHTKLMEFKKRRLEKDPYDKIFKTI